MTDEIEAAIRMAIQRPDEVVVRIEYVDCYEVRTRRIISPYRMFGAYVIGLDLGRESVRCFLAKSIMDAEIVSSNDVLMPTEIEVINE